MSAFLDRNTVEFKLKDCNCNRRISSNDDSMAFLNEQYTLSWLVSILRKMMTSRETSDKKIKYNDTTCSKGAFLRGSEQKVIAYSIYGDIASLENQSKGNLT